MNTPTGEFQAGATGDVFDLDAGVAEAKIALSQAKKEKFLRNVELLRAETVKVLAILEQAPEGFTSIIEYGPAMHKEVEILMAELRARGHSCTNYGGMKWTTRDNPKKHCKLEISRIGEEIPWSQCYGCNLL